MSTLAIFLLGVVVSAITFTAAFFIGLSEAADTSQSRIEDLTSIEKYLVGRPDEAEQSCCLAPENGVRS